MCQTTVFVCLPLSTSQKREVWRFGCISLCMQVPVVNFCPSEAVCTSPLSEAHAFVPVSVSICEFVCECACPGVRLLAAGHGL